MPRQKTSIYVDEDLWREFITYVVITRGNRKLSDTIEEAITEFMQNHPKK